MSCFSLWMLLSVGGRQPWLPPEKNQVPGREKTNAPDREDPTQDLMAVE